MAIDGRVLDAARDVGEREGVAPAALLAVALVETRGVPFVEVKGAKQPLIRFEGHYFDRLLPEALRSRAREAGLAHPRAGRIANPPGQGARWALYEAARAFDAEAAAASVSWGLCQVMGLHGPALGFGSAAELAEMARASIIGQPVHMTSPLVPALLLLVSLAKVDLADHHRRVIWRAALCSLVMLGVALLLGVVPLG